MCFVYCVDCIELCGRMPVPLSLSAVSILCELCTVMWQFSCHCLSRSKTVLLYPEHQTSPGAHQACPVDVVDPSPAMKQLIHEADHLSLFSAEVAHVCVCTCASPKCLHGVHRDSFTFYCFSGMAVSAWKLFCPAENKDDMELQNIV
jgi:hypothetical protein